MSSIVSIPKDNLLDVLQKMNISSMAKMRQATSSMNALVEKNRYKLMKPRDSVELRIDIDIQVDESELKIEMRLIYSVIFNYKLVILENPRAQLSGIGISKVFTDESYVLDEDEEIEKLISLLPDVTSTLRDLRITPEIIKFNGACQEFIENVLGTVGFPKKIKMKNNIQELIYKEFFKNPTVMNCSDFETKISDYPDDLSGHYEMVKDFSYIDFAHADVDLIKNFIKEIYKLPTVDRLRRMQFCNFYDKKSLKTLLKEEGLPAATLFSEILDGFAEKEELFHSTRLRKSAKDAFIYLLEGVNKWIAVSEQVEGNYISFIWCKKTPSALLKALEELIFKDKKIAESPDFLKFVEEFSSPYLNEQIDVFERLCYDFYFEKEEDDDHMEYDDGAMDNEEEDGAMDINGGNVLSRSV